MKKPMLKRFLALFLAFSIVFLSVDTSAFAKSADVPVSEQDKQESAIQLVPEQTDNKKEESTNRQYFGTATGYIDEGYRPGRLENENLSGDIPLDQTTVIPSSYRSPYVSSVKNQNPYGTCWAFSIIAAMESYVLSRGYATEVDFSEYALVYQTFVDDMYVEQTGDYTTSPYTIDQMMRNGGNDQNAFKALNKGIGIYNEMPGEYGATDSAGNLIAYVADASNSDYVLTGVRYISMEDPDQVKEAVMQNGAATISYYSNDAYQNDDYTYYYYSDSSNVTTNHAVTLVGWDDTISRDWFTTPAGGTPSRDGAWLVKNSWGIYAGDDGYMWISYDDVSVNYSDVTVYQVAPRDQYDNLYQHDGATAFYASTGVNHCANVFEITGTGAQLLKAVSFATTSVQAQYEIEIYKHEGENTFHKGTLVATASGKTTHEGYYTAKLNETVVVNPGEVYSVIIKFSEIVYVVYGYSFDRGSFAATSTSQPGQSFYYNGFQYVDLNQSGRHNFCIKLFTDNIDANTLLVPSITDIKQISGTQNKLTWQTMEGAVGYKLWIGNSNHDPSATIVDVSENTYTDTIPLDTTKFYRVAAVYENGVSEYSDYCEYRAKMEKPVLKATNKENGVELQWTGPDFAEMYLIYRGINGAGSTLYQMIDVVEGQTAYTFIDTEISAGQTYRYYVSAMCNVNHATHTVGSDSVVVTVDVPSVEFTVNNLFSQKLIVGWEAMQDVADGYEIYLEGQLSADITDPATNRYELNTSMYEAGEWITVSMKSYVLAEGNKVYSDAIYQYVTAKGLPTKCAEDGYVLWDMFEYEYDGTIQITLYMSKLLSTSFYLYYFPDESDLTVYERAYLYMTPYDEDEISTAFHLNYGINDFKNGIVYICSMEENAALSEQGFKVGGTFEAPELETIPDVRLESGQEGILLSATVKNPVENLKYFYQWYRLDSLSDVPVMIDGATDDSYYAHMALLDTDSAYFYCEVTAYYKELQTVSTTNGYGKPTRILDYNGDAGVKVGLTTYVEYTGQPITQNPIVEVDGERLVFGEDYTISYSDNINAGVATITIHFCGAYTYLGTETEYFVINPRLATNDAILSDISEQSYTGSAVTPKPTVTNLGIVLQEGIDYTLSWFENINVGTATVFVHFCGNYQGVAQKTFEIQPKKITSASQIRIEGLADGEFNGGEWMPVLSLYDGDHLMTEVSEYTVFYPEDCVSVGEKEIIIQFVHNYTGTLTIRYQVTPVDGQKVTLQNTIPSYTYSGIAINPPLVLQYGDYVLAVDKDYTVSYENNVNAGTASAKITFTGNFTGEKIMPFTILPYEGPMTVEPQGDVVYSGNPIDVMVKVLHGATLLQKDVDYYLEFAENANLVNAGTVSYKVIGTGNYSGILYTGSFEIKPLSIENTEVSIADIKPQRYTGSPIKPSLTIRIGDKELTEGVDYECFFGGNVEMGDHTANVLITFIGNYVGEAEKTFSIVEDIYTFEYEKMHVYSGLAICPEIVIIRDGNPLTESADYTVEYRENVNAGEARIIVTFLGEEYAEVRELAYTIQPKSYNEEEFYINDFEFEYIFANQKVFPEVIVKIGNQLLQEGRDYAVHSTNNFNAGVIRAEITFLGNYTGTANAFYDLNPYVIENLVVEMESFEIAYTGEPILPKLTVKAVLPWAEITFPEGADYTIEIAEGINHTDAGQIVEYRVIMQGNYVGEYTGEFKIVPEEMDTEQLVIGEIEKQPYTGAEVKPELTISYKGRTLVQGVDFTVEYINNIEIGVAIAVVTFSENYNFDEEVGAEFEIISPIPNEITSQKVSVSENNGFISKITVGMTAAELIHAINEKEYVAIYKDGQKVDDAAVIGTGMLLSIMDGNEIVKTYTIIVTGDTNGDGKINITDMVAIKAMVLKKGTLTGAYEKAADTNADGKINITDFIKAKAVTLKKDTMTGVAVR